MEGAQRYCMIIFFVSTTLLLTLAHGSSQSTQSPVENDGCLPVVLEGKEIPQKATYRVDGKRSFGEPGKESRPVKKKHCEVDLDRSKMMFSEQPRDCSDIQARGVKKSGIYGIYPRGDGSPFNVFCDMDTDGGGWTVFQRRKDGSVDFNRDWSDYKHGFGSVSSEHWLGNDKIHRLASQTAYELRVDLEAFDGQRAYAKYSRFNVDNEAGNYTLTVSGHASRVGSSLMYHSGYPFSTRDRDNDALTTLNCAQNFKGGWWFRNCFQCNLNGLYYPEDRRIIGVVWQSWLGYDYSMKGAEMKVRPVVP